MIIRKATEDDLIGIVSIYDEIHTREEAGETMTGWIRDIYPIPKTAKDAINRNDMFVQADDSGAVTAVGIINQLQVDVYRQGRWEYPVSDDKVMVLHTLIVSIRPGHRGSGTEFLRFYEKYAKEQGCNYLRIDTNAKNSRAREFYGKHGFHEIGIVETVFNGITGVNLVLLEKKLV